MDADTVVKVSTVDSLQSALQAGAQGLAFIMFVTTTSARKGASVFYNTVLKPFARRVHLGNGHRPNKPAVIMEVLVDSLIVLRPEEVVAAAIRAHVTNLHPDDTLETMETVIFSSGSAAPDLPWRMMPVGDITTNPTALEVLGTTLGAVTREPSLTPVNLADFVSRERAREDRVGVPLDARTPMLDTLFTRREQYGPKEDTMAAIQTRVTAQMDTAAGVPDADLAECVRKVVAPYTDVVVFVTAEYQLLPVAPFPLVPGCWDLAQLADAVYARVTQSPSELLRDRVALLSWDMMEMAHLPRVCAIDLRDSKTYAYGDIAFLMDVLDPMEHGSAPAPAPAPAGGGPGHRTPGDVDPVVSAWTAATLGPPQSPFWARARQTGQAVMEAATAWGFDEDAWHARRPAHPGTNLVPPFDVGGSKGVVITRQASAPEECEVEGHLPALSYMRAALASHAVGAVKASEQAALGLVKRVLGFMVSRNLCSNPYRYMMLEASMNTMLFDGLMQLLTLVSHSDNDVRVFHHLTVNATLTKVSSTCMLRPVVSRPHHEEDGTPPPPPDMSVPGPGGAMAVLYRDVHHFHFGGAAAPDLTIAQPNVGKVLEWHMYKGDLGSDSVGGAMATVPLKKLDTHVSALVGRPGEDLEDLKDQVLAVLPKMTYAHNISVNFGASAVPTTSLTCSAFFAITRFGDNFATTVSAAQKAAFARLVCLTARGPGLGDVFAVVRAPQLIFTQNLQEDFAAAVQLEVVTNLLAAAKLTLQDMTPDDPHVTVADLHLR
jgi:hypothetical protein